MLVPVNYFFLRARDKKEYAWLTTPAIVALFSFGAYIIGYGFKGGRTLLVKVGVVEARAGASAAPNLMYVGLFSPRKTGYDVQLAADDAPSKADADSTLLSEPRSNHPTAGTRILEGDVEKIDDFAVDMWSMRVLKAEGITRLGKGITADFKAHGSKITGTVRNDSRYTLEGCRLVYGGDAISLDPLPPGKQVTIPETTVSPAATGTFLPAKLLYEIQGAGEDARMKRAVLQPLCAGGLGAPDGQPGTFKTPRYPLLVGWIKEPVNRMLVNGGAPREQAATLLLVHLR